ncbi:sugar O-acyltransferase, sialic acid O-acetyltransferase NeuD family [Actinokineospora alba]|uniref:Sugar O-acyltransferase, sialic acid O-acetyltransferase NeuD family n=1 Tax=Actinokineospora alba TaxID=504798 RepID=A0A1H0PGK1_9PSEU|nr:NeuD/PglB/VioB family sugar acetyltransferase [Actinokineospora alba]TDP65790.1 sugar O-acyltransferase (sialic acid O-acetyltransferase NeuD family) [Actinokineospora alba]SDI65083.1 sugar O-acyltransferase, sialic acid O-acetyltransferase NeuD family [Actinokineospora alba]SDP04181.1 sugar O-acyltransferase, sialic acid O-acetyltransferase NeuD family [Actinokineospora alba]
MTRPLLLIGAGGLARETMAAVAAVNAVSPRWELLGLLDANTARHGAVVDGATVLGPVEAVHDHPDAEVLICTASSRDAGSRLRIAAELGLANGRYATLVHPAASVAAGTEIGAGTMLFAGCVVTAPQRIGEFVLAMPQVLLTHDDEVGDGVTLAGRVALAGAVRVGTGAYLGAGALVREGLRIGERALVGMGAVVLQDIPDGETWAGVPARKLPARIGVAG